MVVSGIIRPPTDIRAVADKTALFVAKNGRAFEQRIMNSEKGKTPKFAFLQTTSPFHAYYEDKIQFYTNGGTDDEPAREEEKKEEEQKPQTSVSAIKKQETSVKATAIDPVAKALLEQRDRIQKEREAQEKENEGKDDPAPIRITRPPALDFVNITAPPNLKAVQIETIKLVAQFTALDTSKGFLQNLTIREWNNPLLAFLQPRHPNFAYFSALTDSYKHLLRPTQDKLPTSKKELLDAAAYRAEYQRDLAERKDQGNAEMMDPIDWHDFVLVETIEFALDEVVDQPIAPTLHEHEQEEEMDLSDEEGEKIRVVPNYQPKIKSTEAIAKAQTHVIDPITGKSIPVSDMAEHMRIQLLDPRWAEEKKKFQEKQKESNLVGGDAIAANLARVVGNTRTEFDREMDPRKRLMEANRLLQQQAQQAGPRLPPPVSLPPPVPDIMMLPDAKRARLELPPLPSGMPPAMPPPISLPPPPIMRMGGIPPDLPPGVPPGMPPGVPPPPFDPTSGFPPPPEEIFSEDNLIPDTEFAATLPTPNIQLEILIPHDATQMAWNFYGQTVSLNVPVMGTIKQIKEELRTHLNDIAINKIQIKSNLHGFLKDNLSMAYYNLGPLVSLEMVPKTRIRKR